MAAGPVEFTEGEAAFALVFVGLVPPLVVAVVGSLVNALVLGLRRDEVTVLPIFLQWWGWCTALWIGGWIIASLAG